MWFQWCWLYDNGSKTKQLARWLGPAHQTGHSFYLYIIKPNGQYLAHWTVISIPDNELQTDDMKKKTSIFMSCLNEMIGNEKQPSFNMQNTQEIYNSNFGDELDDDENDLPYGIKLHEMETDNVNKPFLYINA